MSARSLAHYIDYWCAMTNKSQRELAKIIHTTPALISRWKSGTAPSMRSAYKLSAAIGVPVADLLKDFTVVPEQEAR